MTWFSILFVCLGNICRSPLAETIFRKYAENEGIADRMHIDSAGLGRWHQGEKADPRMIAHARRRGYEIESISRPIVREDFESFDLIVAMDESVREELMNRALTKEEADKVVRMVRYCEWMDYPSVPDPYYGGSDGFELVLDILEDACGGLLKDIVKNRLS